MQNMGRWGPRDHPLEKCVEKMPSADCRQAGYLRTFRRHPIRAFFAHEKAAHFSSEWASKGRRRSFFHRMGARGNGSVHFSSEWALGEMVLFIFPTGGPLMDREGPMAPRAGGPAVRGAVLQEAPPRTVADVPRGRAGALVRARTGAEELTMCCDRTFRINDKEQ